MEVDGKNFNDMYKHWDRSGKTDFIKLFKEKLEYCNGKVAYEKVNKGVLDIKKLLCNLCYASIRGQLKIDQVVSTFNEITDLYSDAPILLADLFSVLEVELSCCEDNDERERFNNLVLASLNVVPDCLLKDKLDPEVLENMGLLQSKTAFQQKYVKTKTKIYYKQQKFNLLREETEGYSKLITELSQEFPAGFHHDTVLQHIQSLIGCFNLDPNRVLDIILDVFECRPEKEEIFAALLSEYAVDRVTLCHILGFKFHFYQHTPDVVTKPSLYHVTALLLSHNLISLEHLMPHLIPSDSEVSDRHKKELAEARQYCQKMNTTLLSEKSTAENKEEKSDQDDVNNQKLGLCEALLNVGCWEHALTIISSFPLYSAMIPSVAQSLCNLVHYIIDPVYLKHSGMPQEILTHRSIPSSYPSKVKQAKTYNDLNTFVFPLVKQLGPHLSCDPVLLSKINRIAKTYMSQRSGTSDATTCEVFCQLMMIYDECILPSLTLMPGNCCISEDIWGFMKLVKYEHRFRLYGQWRNDSYSRIPVLMKAHADVLSSTKYIMKRLVKENVKQVGRQIGKLSHRAPGVVFEQILAQIQRYDNFILPVVDSMKYITSLSYDVLVFTVIEALASPDKERLKTDGSNISTWLQSLANFSGYVLKKYQVDIAGLLHYILNQLKAGRSCDLYVLREVIQKMTGIEVSEEVTTDQLMSMGGGELLKQEAGYFTQARNTKKPSSRLMDCLNEQNLTIPFCILMAQQRNAIIFPKTENPQEPDTRHVKLVGKLFDQCQDTLVQFISFLSMQMTPEELKRKLPNLLELSRDNFITPEVAFALWRRIFTNEISIRAEELRKAEKKDKNSVTSSQSSKMLKYYEAVESVMAPIRVEFIEPTLPPKLWEELNLQFYTTFWSLDMYDLEVPTAAYENQVKNHQNQLQTIEDNKELAQSKKKKEKERCNSLIDKLNEEEKRQEEHIKMVMQRLKQERDQWFSTKLAKHSTITAILQHCLFPRCCFTATDAIYCAKFLYTLHNLKTPNFSSLICYDRIFVDITWSVSSCTENEAHRYGRFLNAVLSDVMTWHSDKAVYDKECANYPGFMTVFRSTQTNQNTVADHLDYENFRHVVHKWHFGLTRVSVNCLESNDYIQMRNMLIILTKIIPNYPKIVKLGVALEKRVEKVIEQEKDNREDLYHLAFGYCGQLKNSKKTWVQDHQFHKKEPDNKAKNAAGSASSNQQNDTNSTSPAGTAKVDDDKTSADAKSTSKQASKARSNEDDDKSNSTGKSSDVLSKPTASSSSRTSKDQSKSSRDRIDQKDSSSGNVGSDKRDGDQQRSGDNSPLTRKIRVGDQQMKVRDSGDWSADHLQEDSVTSNETPDLNNHRSSRQTLDERDLKRRKIDGGSGSKESISHSDSRERSRRSPNYEDRRGSQLDWDRKRDNSKERLDRKRQSTGIVDSDRNENTDGRESKRYKGDDAASSREGSGKINGSDDKRRESRTKDKKDEVDKLVRAPGKDDEQTKDSKAFHTKDDSILKERSKDHGSRIKKTVSTKESERRLSSEKHSKKPKAR